MTNIYLKESDEEAIMNFGKDRKDLYDKTNEHFKDKAKKVCLWERFANTLWHTDAIKVWIGLKR